MAENKEDLKLYDSNSAMKVVYCVYDNPSILSDDKYSFRESDFVKDFHRYVFGAINNLYQGGTQRPTIQDIHDYLEKRPSKFFEYEANGGDDWFNKAESQVDTNSFDYYYGRLKKFSLLRGYKRAGFNTNLIYDPDTISPQKRQEQEEKLDNTDLEGFVGNIERRFEKVKEECVDSYNDESFQIGDDIEDTLEKIKNGESRGFRLYDTVLDSITRGARRGAFYIRSGQSGLGKGLPNNSLVPTPEGFRRVGDIRPGDQLFDAHGKPTNVLGVFPQGLKDVWRVTFKSGRTVTCSPDHLWSYKRANRQDNDHYTTRTIEEISEQKLQTNGGLFNILVPITEPVEYSHQYLPIPPYVMGLILGNGSFRCLRSNNTFEYNSNDTELTVEIAKEMGYSKIKKHKSSYSWNFELPHPTNKQKNVHVKDYPEFWNARSEDKFIPDEYLIGDVQQRIDLLNGLLDTDGSVDERKGRVTYFTLSKKLRDQVKSLCESLGMTVHVHVDTHKDTLPCYGLHIQCGPEMKLNLFRLKRKHDRVVKWYNNGNRKEFKAYDPIVKIENLHYQEEMTCLLVDNEEHLFLTDDYVVTHNTRAGLADALYMSCDKIWDDNDNCYVNIGQKIPTLFVSVELDKEELQTMALAFISGVDEDKILNNDLGFSDEQDRVEKAKKILKESELKCEYIEDYSLKDVEMLCKRHIRDDHTVCIFWDYITSSMKLLSEISRAEGGGRVQEYQALNYLSSKLKEIAKTYNVFVFSSTQLNGNAKNDKYVDSNSISGSKSIINKCDFYMAMTNLYPEEKDEIENIMYRTSTEPNVKVTIAKNRRGRWNNIFLFMRADRGKLRFKTCFATDFDYNLIDIPIYGEKKDVQ